jgi:hypothetical protein
MARHTTRLAGALCGLAASGLLAGCGGGSSSGQPADNRPTGGGGLNGISLSNCLTDENWLVAPSEGSIEGLSEAGAPVVVRILASPQAAKAAAGTAKNKRVVGRTVVSFQEQATSSNTGGEPGTVDPSAIATVKQCVDRLDAS